MVLIVKVHHKRDQTIVSVIDGGLFGKVFEEGERILNLKSDFYNGHERSAGEIGDLIRNADSVSLVGEEAVQLGLKEGIIDTKHVSRIKGIPYAQALLLHE